jgi:Holliday junction resolvase-like predicted endonuclease
MVSPNRRTLAKRKSPLQRRFEVSVLDRLAAHNLPNDVMAMVEVRDRRQLWIDEVVEHVVEQCGLTGCGAGNPS